MDKQIAATARGTVDMVVGQIPGEPQGTFGIESLRYTFAGVPEPASLGLLAIGLALVVSRRRLPFAG